MKVKFMNLLYVTSCRMWLTLLVCALSAQTVLGQSNISVSGNVTDSNGETMPGVTVRVKNTSIGTVTDINGNYTLSSVSTNATLVFSMIGSKTIEIELLGRTIINTVMVDDTLEMEEVVVTAFATQRRVNVTGAISVVSGSDVLAAPVSNISSALVGITPGLSAITTTGEPGLDAAAITIRGVATYGNSQPLIVIDGVEQAAEQAFTAFNNIDPNDILGISILKDASSTAVYGIRGANGVIIITTKRGSVGKPKVSVSGNFGLTQAAAYQQGLSSYDWAMFRNEGIHNEMNSFLGTAHFSNYLYTEDDLWKFKNNKDFTMDEINLLYPHYSYEQKEALFNTPALYYGSRDGFSAVFGRLAPQWQTNVNISGGTDKVKYYASLGYLSQESIIKDYKYYDAGTGSRFSRYNFRANVDIDIIKNTTLSVNISGQFGTRQGAGAHWDPYNLHERYKILMQYIYDATPFNCPGIVDGRLISGYSAPSGTVQNELARRTDSGIGGQNPIYNLLTAGTATFYNTLLDNTIKLKHVMPYIVNGLSIQTTLNYQDNYNRYVVRRYSIPTYTMRRGVENPMTMEYFGGSRGTDSFDSWGRDSWNKLYIDAGIYYDGTFDEHSVGVLFLGKASKYTMPGDSNNTPSGILGLVGRFTYDYGQRYMVEFNMGYNGTEQFEVGNRFGFFPAFSAGWVPTNEPFFPKNDWLTFFKVRGSYGVVGNDLLGDTGRRYLFFPSTFNIYTGGYWLGNSDGSVTNPYYIGANEASLGNPNITWEKSVKRGIGIETRFIKDKLSLVLDLFNEERDNILTTLGIIPVVFGVPAWSVPPGNVGKTENKGYEIALGWKDKTGDFSYFFDSHVSYARNKVIYRAEAPNPYPWMNATGHSIGQRFGLKSDGFYNTPEELSSRPFNTLNSNRSTIGDIRYIDINGDGLIDDKDRAPIGYPNRPEYQYSFRTGFNYKGFDIRLLFNGTVNGSFYISNEIAVPFFKRAGNAFQWQYDGRWTPEKAAAGEKITYPRATFDAATSDHNFVSSDFWLRSNNFFKLKNAEVGYTFPSTKRFMQAAGMSSFRIYASGNNLYSFINHMRDLGVDPEQRDQATYLFPLTRTMVFGFNVQF
ncbi:MAG: TonB-dependent receptor [Lentimicrobiaceae bacterium]|nr:TonB-dependent receptor [Lentimicrobiaceae bacterium]